MKSIIGLVGEKGSGKDTFAKFLKEIIKDKSVVHLRFSDLLRQTLKLWGLGETRSNLQKLAQLLEDGFGPGTVAHGIEIQIQNTQADIIILDGIRWQPDVKLLKKFPGSTLIYITADPELRFERLKKRGEKDGENNMSLEQFRKEEKAKNELLIPEIGKKADIKIENNASLKDFKLKVEEVKNNLSLS
ncbi:AAA family ATPase [Candidatus Daviesbacteria bacterium]|nr:AAA family ATPase [Candidatus Daviesbacteria bacterium]